MQFDPITAGGSVPETNFEHVLCAILKLIRLFLKNEILKQIVWETQNGIKISKG